MPYTIKPGSFKYKKSNGQFSEIDCFEGPDLTEEVAALEKGKAPIIIDSATGNPIVIKDGADGLPVEGMKIHFSPVQSGTGDPSPSNIRPISGWIGVNVWRTGTNIFDEQWTQGNIQEGQNTSSTSTMRTGFINVHPSTSYYCYTERTAQVFIFEYDGEGNYLNRVKSITTGNVLTTGTGTEKIRIVDRNSGTETVNTGINYPSDDTEYHPYTGQSYSVTFPILGKNLFDEAYTDISTSIKYKPIYVGNSAVTLSTDNPEALQGVANLFLLAGDVSSGASSITNGVWANNPKTVTPVDGYVTVAYRAYSGTTSPTQSHTQLEKGQTPTAYEPYTKTVYGGTLDAVNRILMVEWELVSVKWGDFDERGAINQETGLRTGHYSFTNEVEQCTSQSTYETKTLSNITNQIKWSGADTTPAHYYISSVSVLWMTLPGDTSDETVVQVCGKLKTPYEIQLDPVTITTLLGDNTIWSDANGDIELDYRADTKLFCQKNDQVNDVQINGTSILDENGVANIPVAGTTNIGACRVNGYGLYVSPTGQISTVKASTSLMKSGTNEYYPIVPYNQHESVFYALAKLAGADMASSSNPVGQFTPEAIVAIQKMLGVYQAPWELIREDTVTNAEESDIEITVDGNGLPFELTDVAIAFTTPLQDNLSGLGGSGNIRYYYDSSNYIVSWNDSWQQSANSSAYGTFSIIENIGGGLIRIMTMQKSVGVVANMRSNWASSLNGNNMGLQIIPNFAVSKVVIRQVTGTGHYKLYGRRKWTT